jgi:hypothetical protein
MPRFVLWLYRFSENSECMRPSRPANAKRRAVKVSAHLVLERLCVAEREEVLVSNDVSTICQSVPHAALALQWAAGRAALCRAKGGKSGCKSVRAVVRQRGRAETAPEQDVVVSDVGGAEEEQERVACVYLFTT